MSRGGEMRGTRVEIQTSDSQLAEITRALDAKRRKGTQSVDVSIDALRHLHHDHLELLDALRSRRLIVIVAGDDQESIRSIGKVQS